MVSFEVDASVEDSDALASSFEVFALAESLGGVESLVDHPVSMTHGSDPARRADQGRVPRRADPPVGRDSRTSTTCARTAPRVALSTTDRGGALSPTRRPSATRSPRATLRTQVANSGARRLRPTRSRGPGVAGAGFALRRCGAGSSSSPDTRSRISRPTLNFTMRFDGTSTFSSVRGFCARRAARSFDSNTPNSRNSKRLPAASSVDDAVEERLDDVLADDLRDPGLLRDAADEFFLGDGPHPCPLTIRHFVVGVGSVTCFPA